MNTHKVSIEAVPLPKLVEPHYLVLFHDLGLAEFNEDTSTAPKEKDKRIKQLEQELSQTRENMRSITEDQEAVNEELQSSNEELESSSEELQSLNEEMETSKEELQSTNEELTSLNQELQSLNVQLVRARDYAEIVVDTIREPLLILDKNLHVISANKTFYKTFKAREEQTEGKLVYNIGNKQWDIPELRTLLGNILPEKEGFTNFEVTHDFQKIGTKTMLLNARQIFSPDNEDNRILLAIEDITEVKKAGEKNARLSAIVESSEDAIISKTLDGSITSWNKGAEKIFGYNPKETIGKHISIIIPPEHQQEEDTIFDKVKKGEKVNEFESIRITKEGKKVPISLTSSLVKDAEGEIIGISEISRDISDRKEAAKKIEESERLYHELIYSSPSLIATFTGEDHKIGIANNAIIEAWGKGKEVIDQPILEAVPELKEQGFKEIMDEVYKTGEAQKFFEMPVDIFRNGKMERSYYNFTYYPQRDINNNITGIVDIATEVTPQAEFNLKLKESESHFRKMADLMPGKILNTDEEGNAYYFNRHWLSDTGHSQEELEGRGWQNCIHLDDFETFISTWKDSLNTGKEFEMEFRCASKNDGYKWHLGRAVPLKNNAGKIKFWINSAIEIQKLKDEEKRKEDFLKMVSHELKTPVTSIKGYVQLLLSILKKDKDISLDSLPLKPSLERIDIQIGRLSRLISEMLDLSRLEDNKLVFQNKVFSINELVDETIQDINHSRTGQKIKIEHKFKCNIKADKDRIGQVLINLITNSIKYSSNNQPVEVKIKKGENNYVRVSVKDHGIGIAENDLQKIFDRFYRVTGENEDTYAGFGIGLFLSNEIVKRHKGSLSVKSKIGEGSVFSFSLPYEV
jgi:two-component system CheB/CheR fusion protein